MSVNGSGVIPGALYRIASMTKPVTAAAVLQQVEKGKINLMSPVSDYLTGFEDMKVGHEEGNKVIIDRAAAGTVLVYNLLTHTSGIGTASLCVPQSKGQPKDSLENVAKYYAKQPLAFDPGTAQSYSPTAAFDVAARIVETVSGEAIDEYLKKNIFEPLGMTDTTFNPSDKQWEKMIRMHSRDDNGNSCDGNIMSVWDGSGFKPTYFCAGGGLASTAEDYSKFVEMLLNGGEGADGKRVLDIGSVRRMRTPYVPESIMSGSERWGLGVRVITEDDYPHGLCRGCYGWSGAYGSHFWIDPINRITAIYMKNSTYDGGAGCRTGCVLEEDITASLE